MANISSASGTFTLVGTWTQEAVDLLKDILGVWSSWEYGLWVDTELSPDCPSGSFSGAGRWGFASTLESYPEWTKESTNGTEKEAVYKSLLYAMHKYGLSIELDFKDRPDEGGNYVGTGCFRCDTEQELSVFASSEESNNWDDYKSILQDIVSLLADYLSAPDRSALENWVCRTITPHPSYLYELEYDSIFGEYNACDDPQEVLLSFVERFAPDTEAWKEVCEEAGAEC